jgi:hypothetical protein
MVVLDPVYGLTSLQIQLHALEWLLLLKGQDELVDHLEDFSLINFDQLHAIFIGRWDLLVHACSHFDVGRQLEKRKDKSR